jgi:hypothetical protein
VISHFFNEEFLLESWLKHHYSRFEHGILIDYDSTDKSLEVIEAIAPDWEILEAPSEWFDAVELDAFIMRIEKKILGPRIALTTTEFFLGNPAEVVSGVVVPTIDLINMPSDLEFDTSKPWHEQRKFGYHYLDQIPGRPVGRGRLIHTSEANYSPGRHFEVRSGGSFLMYRVANCLVNEEMINRKLQIQRKISLKDKQLNFGFQHHNSGKGLSRNEVLFQESLDRENSKDLSDVIKSAVLRESLSKILENPALIIGNEVISGLIKERDFLIRTSDAKELNLIEASTESNSLRIELDNLRNEVATLIEIKQVFEMKIHSIKQSASWRITKPFRVAHRAIKRLGYVLKSKNV